jgi:hypothetical protein
MQQGRGGLIFFLTGSKEKNSLCEISPFSPANHPRKTSWDQEGKPPFFSNRGKNL